MKNNTSTNLLVCGTKVLKKWLGFLFLHFYFYERERVCVYKHRYIWVSWEASLLELEVTGRGKLPDMGVGKLTRVL